MSHLHTVSFADCGINCISLTASLTIVHVAAKALLWNKGEREELHDLALYSDKLQSSSRSQEEEHNKKFTTQKTFQMD